MKNFSPEFKTPEQYIIDITYQIWEERGIDRLLDWYAAEGPVRTPHTVTRSVQEIIKSTENTLIEFPDRQLLPEDIIIGDLPEGFLSSHRVRSTATHLGDGVFGKATSQPITYLTLADCLCRNNQVVEEWLVRDQAWIAKQLGLDPVEYGKRKGQNDPEAYLIGNQGFTQRWNAPGGFSILGDQKHAPTILQAYEAIWKDRKPANLSDWYDRAIRFEGPAGELHYGQDRMKKFQNSILTSIPDGKYQSHHLMIQQEPDKNVRAALRWSFTGSHSGPGRYGNPSGYPLSVLGISHFELRYGKIVNEWFCIDETAIYAQIGAYQAEANS